MSTPDRHTTVIVGAGQAGAWCAITLRQADPARRIVLIGDEDHPPYERPPLSKGVLSGKATLDSAYIKPVNFYVDNDIELRLGAHVETIDRAAKAVVLAGGEAIPYTDLVLATGARARTLPVPGADDPRVHTLRNAADVQRIRERLTPQTRVVAIGAGFIGLEFTAAAAQAGCPVTVVDAAPSPLNRALDPSVAQAVESLHRQRGVAFRFSASIVSIAPRQQGAAVVLGTGEMLEADMIIVGIGATPNTELAAAAGLAVDNGIVVDAAGRTSDPAVFAVGDCTNHFNPLLGRSLRLESWQNAQNQAIAVAKIMTGQQAEYAEIPWFWTDQYDANLQIIGAPAAWDRLVWRGDPQTGKFTAIYLDGDRVVAGNTMNNPRDIRFLKQLIASGKRVDPEVLARPETSLAELARA